MEIRLFGVTDDSIVDGPGLRMAVFVQGCTHRCPGCHNPGAHDPGGGFVARTEELLSRLRANPLETGLTLSGGEPFEQAEACFNLAEGARAMGKDIWIYSGYTWEELRAGDDPARLALLRMADVLIDGRFLLAERTLEAPFRGSRNQRLIDVRASIATGVAALYEPAAWSR